MKQISTVILGLVLLVSCTSTTQQNRSGPIKLTRSEYSIPHRDVPALANKVLDEHKGNMLTPELVDSLSPLNKLLGWKFSMVSPTSKAKWTTSFTYTGASEGSYYFDYGNSLSDKVHKYKWMDGYRYSSKNENGSLIYSVSEEEKCKFVIGECSYKSYDGKNKVMYTEFRDGMWIRNKSTFRMKRAVEMNIYDSSGLPLYLYFEPRIGNPVEEIRQEPK